MSNQNKTQGQLLEEQLLMAPKNGAEILSDEEIAKADEFCEGYKAFLKCAKTEREAVAQTVKILKDHGYVEFDPDKKYGPGDKVYYNNRGKALCFATIGTRSMKEGIRLVASHIDSPRVDLKPNPLYEDAEIGYFKTHYYGGIRKYQWTAIPLSLHGVIVKKGGEAVTVSVGDEPGEPVFSITDLYVYIIVIVLNGFTGGGVAAMLWASGSEVVPSHLISGATAALACSQSVGMFLGSMFMGNVIAAVGYTMAGWYVLVPCFGLGLLAVIFGLRGKLK